MCGGKKATLAESAGGPHGERGLAAAGLETRSCMVESGLDAFTLRLGRGQEM